MRAVVQRVSEARVDLEGETVGSVGRGLLVLLGVGHDDTEATARAMAAKVAKLRIFEDDEGKMNRSLKDIRGEILAVSQFTLYGRMEKGRRPSFIDAAPPEMATSLFDLFVEALSAEGVGSTSTSTASCSRSLEPRNKNLDMKLSARSRAIPVTSQAV